MPQIVYGVFEDIEQARAGAKEFAARTATHPSLRTDIYKSAPFDGDHFPDSATDADSNTLIHVGIGALTCLVMGLAGGATGIIPGLTAGMGALMGALFGVLAGLVNGMTAGAKTPKAELMELEDEVRGGRVLLLVEVEDHSLVKVVQEGLEQMGSIIRGRC
jgi:hypothetical protein